MKYSTFSTSVLVIMSAATAQGALPFVCLESIERAASSEGNNFTIRFTKNIQNLSIVYEDSLLCAREPSTFFDESSGHWVTSFLFEEKRSPWVTFGNKDEFHTLVLMLKNEGPAPMIQSSAACSILDTIPSNELVYDPGEDAYLPVSVGTYESASIYVSSNDATFHEVNFSDLTETWLLIKQDNLLSRTSNNITIDTSTHSKSGFLDLNVAAFTSGTEYITIFIQERKTIPVRPSTQNNTFPRGFVAIRNDLLSPRSTFECRVGGSCVFRCLAFGDKMTRMSVEEVLEDGTLKVVTSAQTYPYKTPNSQAISWMFTPDEDSGDANGFSTFQCCASDDTLATHAAEEIRIQVKVDSSLVTDKTHAEVRNDSTDPSAKIVTFVCTAKGRPFPRVAFQEDSLNVFRGLQEKAIRTSGRLEISITSSISVDADSLEELKSQIQADNATGPLCEVRTRGLWHYQWHLSYTFTFFN
ncbi:hypothetical protein PoB_003889300 [Plakobranchus ocellatus]|uniref:Ig-like domain-containing protein n=1 Tax=Plakobranchus ocellatus TaxID=259542 RepID=A0AAV4B0Y0_9GAST|nr:hypothetical protein PoB_003889300 [Plakobranchus ocellatus]